MYQNFDIEGSLEQTASWAIILLSWSLRKYQTSAWSSFKHFRDSLLRGENISCLQEQPHLLSKRLKAWGSAALLKWMSHSKNSSRLPEAFAATQQLFFESLLLHILSFTQTAKAVSPSTADVLFLNRGSIIYFQLKILIAEEIQGIGGILKKLSKKKNSFFMSSECTQDEI